MQFNTIWIVTFLICSCFSLTLSAQSFEREYFNTPTEPGQEVHVVLDDTSAFFVAGTYTTSQSPAALAITKIDTNGQVVWSTQDFDNTSYPSYGNRILFVEKSGDGHIYAIVRINSNLKIWKVDALTGAFVWRVPMTLPAINNTHYIGLTEIGNNRLFFSYRDSNGGTVNYWGVYYDKSTGAKLNDIRLYHGINGGLTYDGQGYIYYAGVDSIFKMPEDTLNMPVWKAPTPNEIRIRKIHIEPTLGQVYYFGTKKFGEGGAGEYDPTNGNLLWSYFFTGNYSANYSDMEMTNNHIYITWQHTYVGGGSTRVLTSKIARNTGAIAWEVNHNFTGKTGRAAAYGLDLDENDNVYLTGYTNDANYGPEEWFVFKLNGSNGNKIYEVLLTEDENRRDKHSEGRGLLYHNGKIHLVGAQTGKYSSTLTHAAYYQLDAATGAELKKVFFNSSHIHPSRTVKMMRYGKDKNLVIKTLGRHAQAVMYDYAGIVLWERTFPSERETEPRAVTLRANGNIAVATRQTYTNFNDPSFLVDSIKIHELDSAGNWLNTYGRNISNGYGYDITNIIPSDSTGYYVFYHNFSGNYFSRFGATGPSVNLTMQSGTFALDGIFGWTRYDEDKYAYMLNWSQPWIDDRLIVKDVGNPYNPLVYNQIIDSIMTVRSIVKVAEDTMLLCGVNDDMTDMVLLWDMVNNHTIWRFNAIPNGETYSATIDRASNSVFTQGMINDKIMVKKLDFTTGNIIWFKTYNGNDGLLDDVPQSITYDPYRNLLVHSGIRYDTDGQKAFFQLLDANNGLVLYDHISGAGDSLGVAGSTLMTNGASLWIGGGTSVSPIGAAGFIYKLDELTGAISRVIDTCLTDTTTFTYGLNNTNIQFLWDNSLVDSSITIAETGTYQLETKLNDIHAFLTVNAAIVPTVNLGTDTTLPAGQLLILDANQNTSGYNYLWNNGSTLPSLTVFDLGTYFVEVSDGICTVSDTIEVEAVTNMVDLEEFSARVYPNPASDFIQIELPEMEGLTIRLWDLSGRLIREAQMQNINSTHLEWSTKELKGTYLLTIEKDKIAKTYKIIITN